jgi:Peptidase C39 family/Protein of unknown function (DUF1573)
MCLTAPVLGIACVLAGVSGPLTTSGDQGAASLQRPMSAESDTTIELPSIERACGAISLYIWLRLIGHEANYDQVLEYVGVTEEGSSLAQLSEAAQHWTKKVGLLKGEPRDLDWLPLPAIAHGSFDGKNGHYVVIVNVTPQTVTYVNGPAGGVVEAARLNFQKNFWSGYVLVPEDATGAGRPYIVLGVVASVALMGWIVSRRRLRPAPMLALLMASVVCGCDQESATVQHGYSPLPTAADAILAFSGSTKDLGTVKLGESAKAVFTLSNTSKSGIDLSLGQPSCNCLGVSLSKERLMPGEASELSILLSQGGGERSGYLGGRVAVGIKGMEKKGFFFEVTGIAEGMKVDDYALRLPADRSGFSPEPLRGEIDLGTDRREVEVKIVDAVVKTFGRPSSFKLGAPVLSDLEAVETTHLRRRFQIPVVLLPGTDQVTSGMYGVQITYRIGDRTADFGLRVMIFPAATIPAPTSHGE